MKPQSNRLRELKLPLFSQSHNVDSKSHLGNSYSLTWDPRNVWPIVHIYPNVVILIN